MPVYGTPENAEFQAEIKGRLQRRLQLATCVAKTEKRLQAENKAFDIVDDAAWEHCRFADIASECIVKLLDPKKRQAFVDTFENAYE